MGGNKRYFNVGKKSPCQVSLQINMFVAMGITQIRKARLFLFSSHGNSIFFF